MVNYYSVCTRVFIGDELIARTNEFIFQKEENTITEKLNNGRKPIIFYLSYVIANLRNRTCQMLNISLSFLLFS